MCARGNQLVNILLLSDYANRSHYSSVATPASGTVANLIPSLSDAMPTTVIADYKKSLDACQGSDFPLLHFN